MLTTGPNFASEIHSGSTSFHLWQVVQILQRESIFCSKIHSGVGDGGGCFFTVTAPHVQLITNHCKLISESQVDRGNHFVVVTGPGCSLCQQDSLTTGQFN